MSALQDIQQEILRRFQRPRTTPGYAGGELQDQLRRDQGKSGAVPLGGQPIGGPAPTPVSQLPNDQILTPNNQAAITRPRSVFTPPESSDPSATRQRAVSFNSQSGEPTRGFYDQNTDRSAGTTGYRDALEQWKPRGKRGLKQSLKEFAIGAAEGIRANPDHPIEGLIGGGSAGLAGSLIKPGAITRGFKLNRANQEVERRLGEDRYRAQTTAAQSRLGIQQDAQDEREINNALSQYNKLETYDPDDPADAGIRRYFEGRKLSLPKKLKGSNQVLIWRNGRPELVDKVGAEIRPATLDGQPVADAGRTPNAQGLTPNQQATVTSSTENRATRERLATTAESGRNTRAANSQAAVNARASGRGGRGNAPKSTAAANRLVAEYNQALANEIDYNKTRSDVASDNRALDPAMKATLQSRREILWQQVMDTHPGMFEADAQGRLRPKAGGNPSKQKALEPALEKRIRAAAEAKGLNADTAVERARQRQ